MKRFALAGAALLAIAALTPVASAVAMPLGLANTVTAPASGAAQQIRYSGRGHHYGWGHGRGQHNGWSRGRHRGWR